MLAREVHAANLTVESFAAVCARRSPVSATAWYTYTAATHWLLAYIPSPPRGLVALAQFVCYFAVRRQNTFRSDLVLGLAIVAEFNLPGRVRGEGKRRKGLGKGEGLTPHWMRT